MKTVLHHAAFNGKEKALVSLLERGADLHTKDNAGQTSLHCAAAVAKVEALRLLLE